MTASNARWNGAPGHSSLDRRDGQRAQLLWRGDYLVVDPAAPRDWQRCFLVDLSDAGAALEVHGVGLAVGHRLLLRLEAHPGYSEALQLRATVVSRRSPTRPPVYGVEFGGLVPGQRDHLLKITMAARRDRRRRRRYRPDT